MPYTKPKLGTLIRVWRMVNNIPSTELAEAIGISKSVLSRLESGSSVESKTLIKILYWLETKE